MFRNKTIVIFLILMGLFSKSSVAAGWPHLVYIKGINHENVPYEINVELLETSSGLKEECSNFDLILTPKGKRWWDILPFLTDYSPSLDEIEKAVSFLSEAHLKKSKITLDPVGSVLSSTDDIKCSFNIESIKLHSNNRVFIFK